MEKEKKMDTVRLAPFGRFVAYTNLVIFLFCQLTTCCVVLAGKLAIS